MTEQTNRLAENNVYKIFWVNIKCYCKNELFKIRMSFVLWSTYCGKCCFGNWDLLKVWEMFSKTKMSFKSYLNLKTSLNDWSSQIAVKKIKNIRQ